MIDDNRKLLIFFAYKVYTMKYAGRTKVGRIKPNPRTELAIVRLPVDMKEKAGKFAHIWKVDEDTILVRFSENKEVDEGFGVYFSVQQKTDANIEERLNRLERMIEKLVDCNLNSGNYYMQNGSKTITSGRSLAAGQGLPEPLTRVQIPAAAFYLRVTRSP